MAALARWRNVGCYAAAACELITVVHGASAASAIQLDECSCPVGRNRERHTASIACAACASGRGERPSVANLRSVAHRAVWTGIELDRAIRQRAILK